MAMVSLEDKHGPPAMPIILIPISLGLNLSLP